MQCLPFTRPRASVENIQELVCHGSYARALTGLHSVTSGHQRPKRLYLLRPYRGRQVGPNSSINFILKRHL